MTISIKSSLEVLKRSKGKCEGCGCNRGNNKPHHIFFKSQYFGKDRDMPWNLADLCEDECHRILHHASTDEEIADKYKLDFKLKSQAITRYYGKNIKALEDIIRRVRYNYYENISNPKKP